jgi:hypothetical protein
VFELLKVGGVVIHAGPANGWLEHGFYQFSPTLLVDYYVANRFDILEACIIHSPSGDTATAMVYPYVPGAFDHAVPKLTGRSLFYMTFRKQCTSTWEAIPQQRYYREIYGNDTEQDAPHLRYAPPYLLQDGVRLDDERSLHALPAPVRSNGFEWMVHLPEIAHASDGIDRQSSRLMLFEDGVPIGPPHALHAAIQTMGRGRYSHWGERLRFSSSRNDDARAHEYAYALSAHQL